MSTQKLPFHLYFATIYIVSLAACSGGSSPIPGSPADDQPSGNTPVGTLVDPDKSGPTGVINKVSIGTTPGTYFQGLPPDETGSIVLDALNGDSPISIISGGSTEITVKASQSYSTVYVLSDDGGYFQVQLDVATASSDLIMSYSTIQLDGEQVEIAIQVADAFGAVSARQSVVFTSIVVGTGDLQVSVSWDQPTDVDLFLTEPDGTQINYRTKESLSGGMLDLDSNAACAIDGINNESISYGELAPPTGEYVVSISYFDSCQINIPTNYLVTVRTGGTVQTFSGQFNEFDDEAAIERQIARISVQ